MTAARMIAELKAQGAVFEVHGERVSVEAPAGVLRPELVERLRAMKAEIRELIDRAAVDADGLDDRHGDHVLDEHRRDADAQPSPRVVFLPPRVRDPWWPGRLMEEADRDAQLRRHPRYGSPELAEALARYDAAETDLELEDATRALGAVLGWPGARR